MDKVLNMDHNIVFHLFGLPINETLFFTWIVMGLLVLLSWLATRHLKSGMKISRLQTAMEIIVLAVRKQVIDVSGDTPKKYLAIMGTFLLFIGMSNLLTIIPVFSPPTASLSTTAAFASCVFVAIPFFGIRNAGIKKYLHKYLEPTPIMFPLNILSDFSSVFSLAFRLYGNVLSGAVISVVLMMLVPFLLPLPMQLLSLFTGMIQAYIFAILAIVYVSSIAPPERYRDTLTYL